MAKNGERTKGNVIATEKVLVMEGKQNGASGGLMVAWQREGDSDVGGARSKPGDEVLRVLGF